jgi:hypothetical protein
MNRPRVVTTIGNYIAFTLAHIYPAPLHVVLSLSWPLPASLLRCPPRRYVDPSRAAVGPSGRERPAAPHPAHAAAQASARPRRWCSIACWCASCCAVNQKPAAPSTTGMAKALRSCSQSQSFFSPNPVQAHSLGHRERLLGSCSCSTVLLSSPDYRPAMEAEADETAVNLT